MARKLVYIVPSYHCDLVWRRTPEEQAAIRQRQYDCALDMLAACPEFCFEFDQAALVREYLGNNPQRRDALRRYIAEGRVDVTGGEEAIPDTNLVTGEGLARNIFLGRLWFAEELGAAPAVANMEDAFGLNAQLPQLFAGFGYTAFRDARTPGLDPALAQAGVLWEGLDGTRVFYAAPHGGISEVTHVCNLPVVYSYAERRADAFAALLKVDNPVVYGTYSSEEQLVSDDVVRMVLEWPLPKGTTVRFAQARAVFDALRRHNPAPAVVGGEFNPNSPGTHITRIGLKLAYRRAEWATIVAEAAAACAALGGADYPLDRLAAMWRALSAVQFHDALCGCHCDAVNAQVMGYCRETSAAAVQIGAAALGALRDMGCVPGIVAFNPLPTARREPLTLALPPGMALAGADGILLPAERHGDETLIVADLAPLGTTAWRLAPGDVPEPAVRDADAAVGQPLEIGAYCVTPRHDGLRLERRDWGRTLVDGAFPQVRFRLEDGTLWQERFLGPTFTEEAGDSRLTRVETGPVSTRLTWQGAIHGDPTADPLPPTWASTRDGKPIVYADMRHLRWEKDVTFYRELDRIDVTVRVDWDGKNTEILLGFPLQLDLHSTQALYEVPFGMLARKPYFEIPSTSPEVKDAPLHLAALGGKGAWPALGWVAYRDAAWGMVLANEGTPSHRLMSGMIEVGVLRSPTTIGSNFTVPESAWENGTHAFRFALQPFQGDLAASGAYALGAAFNARPLTALTTAEPGTRSLLSLDAPGVTFSAFKHAERGDGYILRTFETMGRAAHGRLRAAFPLARVAECDLMEQPLRDVDPRKLRWRAFEIKTLRIWGE